ncbi:MICOS complex subunit MIC27 [Ictalurus furcatus]|uniref:MICOS complex subunit MIC27 n=1 Tax=Ictalurus furcatus TaxID=66913 RepID=UPI00234FE03F|nr:MICOS complex subunit MIC27 [Ictalurus furcatus]
MAAKVVKLAAVPAALGLASFRVYAVTEEKTQEQISPRELCIYSAEPPALRCAEEKPGHLETGFGLMRAGLQPYVRAVQNTCTSIKVGTISLYRAGQDTYHFLRDPPPGFLPRVGVITVSGLAGLILARKGSRLRRIAVPLALITVGTAVCYPTYTVGVAKVTGKRVYAAGSSVASALKSKPKEEGIVPDTSLKHAAEEVAPVPEVSPTVDAVTEITPASPAVDLAQAEVVPLTTVPDLAPKEAIPSEVVLGVEIPPVHTGVELAPQEETTTPVSGDVALEAVTYVSEAVPTEKTPVAESSPVSEDSPAAEVGTALTVEATPVVEDFPSPEEPTPSPFAAEEAVPPTAPEITNGPPIKEKPQFVPDPSLLDHGQAHPEDADLYSTRG